MYIKNVSCVSTLPVQILCGLFALLLMAQSASAALYTNTYGSALGTVSNCDDCFDGPISFGGGQSINFFGTTYSDLYVGSNGYVTFGAGSSDYSATPLDVQDLEPMIAGLFTDLDSRNDASSVIYANTSTPGEIIVTFIMLGQYSENYTVRSTFQLVIRSDTFAVPSGEGQIGFFYDTVTDPSIASGGFGDGLAAVNPGEVAIFSEVAGSTQNNAAPRWFDLGTGGVPGGGSGNVMPVPTLSDFAMMLLAGLLAITALFVIRRRQIAA